MNNAINLLAAWEMGSQQKPKWGQGHRGLKKTKGSGAARCQNNGKETRPARHNLKHQQRMLSSEQRKRWAVVQGHLSGGLERRRKIGKWTTGRDTQGVWYPHHSEWICCLKSITAGRLTPGSVINVTSWALFSQRRSAFTAHLWEGMGSQARFKEVCKN